MLTGKRRWQSCPAQYSLHLLLRSKYAFLGVVVSYIFYFAAVLRAEADFSAKIHIPGMKEVVFSLESGEATFSQEIRIQKKLVGEIIGLAKDGMPAEVLPVYNLVIYGPYARLVLDGRRMISRDEFTFQIAVMASDSAQVLIEEGGSQAHLVHNPYFSPCKRRSQRRPSNRDLVWTRTKHCAGSKKTHP